MSSAPTAGADHGRRERRPRGDRSVPRSARGRELHQPRDDVASRRACRTRSHRCRSTRRDRASWSGSISSFPMSAFRRKPGNGRIATARKPSRSFRISTLCRPACWAMCAEWCATSRRASGRTPRQRRSRPQQDRGFRELYFKGAISAHLGAHEWKVGGDVNVGTVRERFGYQITDPGQFDPDTPAVFNFDDRRADREQALFVQDQVRLGRLDGQRWTSLGSLPARRRRERPQSPAVGGLVLARRPTSSCGRRTTARFKRPRSKTSCWPVLLTSIRSARMWSGCRCHRRSAISTKWVSRKPCQARLESTRATSAVR